MARASGREREEQALTARPDFKALVRGTFWMQPDSSGDLPLVCDRCDRDEQQGHADDCEVGQLVAAYTDLQDAWADVRRNVPQYDSSDLTPDGLRHAIRQLAALWDGELALRRRDTDRIASLEREREQSHAKIRELMEDHAALEADDGSS